MSAYPARQPPGAGSACCWCFSLLHQLAPQPTPHRYVGLHPLGTCTRTEAGERGASWRCSGITKSWHMFQTTINLIQCTYESKFTPINCTVGINFYQFCTPRRNGVIRLFASNCCSLKYIFVQMWFVWFIWDSVLSILVMVTQFKSSLYTCKISDRSGG